MAIENILIEFTSNTDGITTAEEAVKQLGDVSSSEFARTNTALKQSDEQFKSVGLSIDRFTEKVKGAGQAAAGAFVPKGLAEMNQQVKNFTGSIETLRAKLGAKQYLVTLIDPADLAKIAAANKEIQALQLQISQLSNVGKVGFDDLGNKIEKTAASTNILSKGFGFLRQAAYLIPGIGLAGIFNLIGEGALALVKKLFDGGEALNTFKANYQNFLDVISESNKDAGKQTADLKILYAAATDVNNSQADRLAAVKALQKEFPDYFKNISAETILNGGAKDAYNNLSKSIVEVARATAAKGKIDELESQRLDVAAQKAKINTAVNNEQANAKPLIISGRAVKDVAFVQAEAEQRRIAALREQDLKDQSLNQQEQFLIQFVGQKNITKVVEDEVDKRAKKEKKGAKDEFDYYAELQKQLATINQEEAAGILTTAKANEERQKDYDDTLTKIFDLGKTIKDPLVQKLLIEVAPINQAVLEQKIKDEIAKLPPIKYDLPAPVDNSKTLRDLIVKNTTDANNKLIELSADSYVQDLNNQNDRLKNGLINEKEYYKNIEAIEKQHSIFLLQISVQEDEALIGNLQSRGFKTKKEEEKLAKDRVALAKATAGQITTIEKDEGAKRKAIQQAEIQFGEVLSGGYFDAMKASYDNDLQNVQDLAAKKLITQQEADRRTRAIHKAQAITAKEEALFNIAISVYQAIARDLIGNKFLIPFDIATGITETAFVLARPLPKFKKGKVKIEGPGTDTSDSIHAMISRDESVINAAATRKYQPILEAINNMELEKYMAKLTPVNFKMPEMFVPKFELPTMAPLPKWAEQRMSGGNHAFDSKSLAKEIANEIVAKQGKMKDISGMDIRIDKDGIAIIAKEGINRTEFHNRKFSYKK